MASTSSSSSSVMVTSPRRNYYDVFVSFRGKDTRYNFTDHLFADFQRKGIFAFKDDTNLNKGESIAPELLHAIEGSKIFVVVFSKNYASSTWCLRELECIFQLSGKRILPIFFDVDPSEVRHQNGSFAEAFSKHEQRFQRDPEMIQRWRASLTEVANLSGWDLRDKPQSAEIEKISKEIINILGNKFSSLPKEFVGIDSPIEKLEKHLLLDSVDDVRIVGISGMGGIGKTTLATVLYNKISHQFPVCCIIDDLSKIYRQDGPISAQKKILRQTLGKEHLQICNSYNTSNMIRSRLCHVKSLIILDNVDEVEQVEKLAVSREWLGAGSRIIIISRDEHILKEYGVDVVYKVPLLNMEKSLQLLSQKAFKLDHFMSSYNQLALNILQYANGLPLAIRVLGSFLFGKSISEWESALARLRGSPNKDIMDVLRLSFDGLEEMDKEIFLHIACFFSWPDMKYVKNILNCIGFQADIGLRVLIDKSLISSNGLEIRMHGLLQELGKAIVQEKSSKNSRNWSRVWNQEQYYNVMLENMEKKVEAVRLVVYKNETKTLMVETLSKMSHLRLLILWGVIFSGHLNCLSNELRYVEWDEYPFKCLPSNFQPDELVELILKYSNITQLWKDRKYLPNLRRLDLSHSKNLRKMPDFRDFPNLEQLNFQGCVKLVEVDPSIGVLRKLVSLNLKDCKKLVSIPNNIFGLSSLECLNLSGCPKLVKNPSHMNISEKSSHSQSTTSPILKWTTLCYHSLYPDTQKDLASCVVPSLLSLSNLLKLDISFYGLSQLPDEIGCLRWLQELNLGGNNFVTLPNLNELSRLTYLNLEHCKLLESLPQLPFPTSIEWDFRKNKYSNKKGLLIFNCPGLCKTECCNSITFSWIIQFIQANQEHSFMLDRIDFVVPASEIPCNNQSEGDSIRIDSIPVLQDNNNNNLIGIVCCAVFSVVPVDPITTTYVKGCASIGIKLSGCYNNTWLYGSIPVILERDLIEVKSDHMCLMWVPLESFFNNLKFEDETFGHVHHFHMNVMVKCSEDLGLEVQKCGYCWVHKQNLQTMHHLRNSLVHMGKFLANEAEAQQQSFT